MQGDRLFDCVRAAPWVAWDGNTHVVYSATDGAIYRQRADGTLPASLVGHMPCPGGPVTSSDGRLACSDGRGGIIVMSVNGTTEGTVHTSEFPARLIGWTSDNDAVSWYLEGSSPTWSARTDLRTGKVTRIADLHSPDATGAWRIHPVRATPDQRIIAFSVARELSETLCL